MNDLELLRAYARDGSEAAFAELARRYVGMVYSAALRQVRSAQDAEDVTQAVFLLLSRKAQGLTGGVVVPAWLLRATHFASRTMLRGQSRRKRHETRAATMTGAAQDGGTGNEPSAPDWERIAPLLDEAIATLGEAARDALVLRFFRNKSYREVAERLAIAEPAARQRVSRGVDQLRAYFARRGVVLSAAGLEVMIVANAVHPAPKLLAGLVAALASKGAAVTAKHAALAKGASFGMTPVITKIAAAACVLLFLGGGAITLYHGHHAGSVTAAPASNVQPTAVGLTDAGPIRGRVLDASGRPASGAEVMLARTSSAVSIYGPVRQGVLAVSTAPDGSFEFPSMSDATAVVARSDQGIAQLQMSDLRAGRQLQLAHWGRIEGTLSVGSTPVRGQVIELARTNGTLEEWDAWRIMHGARTKTDSRGRFVFDRVLPTIGNSVIGAELRWQLPSSAVARTRIVRVPPGQVARIELGGTGRPVIGRLIAPAGLPGFTGNLYPQTPATQPSNTESWPPIYPVDVQSDGSFRADDVPAGKYWLTLVCLEKVRNTPLSDVLASTGAQVIIPEMPGGRSDQPLDVGKLEASVNTLLQVGESAPDFVAFGADGKPIRLGDFKGKYLLLYVRAPGQPDGQWVQTSAMKAIHDRFGDNATFSMLEVKVDVAPGDRTPAEVIQQRPWIVATVSVNNATSRPTTAPSLGIPFVYLSGATGLFLIGPDGKCVARSLDCRSAWSMLEERMPRPGASASKVAIHIEHRPPSSDPANALKLSAASAGSQNVATAARFTVVDGQIAPGSGGTAVLNDGRLAPRDDDPSANLFFPFGSLEGRFRMDLTQPIDISQINTYSRHPSHRGPQLYKLYGSDGLAPNFKLSPQIGVDPQSCGWVHIANVDTRPASGPDGGQYEASLSGLGGPIGRYSHLLFVTFATETEDDWGQTFFSEIEVLRQEGKP
jgi:RNA polymerase sigma factor (sigma-70 family)